MAMEPGQRILSKAKPLVKSHSEGDASFETLFIQHYELVYKVLFRLLGDKAEAEDVTQQVFLKLYHAVERVQSQSDEVNIVGWLYRVALNEGYNALRSRKRRMAWHEKFARLWPFVHSSPDPAQLVESQDTQTQVRQILAEMKPRDAKLLLLRHAGLSYKELAIALNIAPSSVGPLLTQAKRTFAQKYRLVFSKGE
jgi:RNA polymerase sigma-70 factor (ECF subfamily)